MQPLRLHCFIKCYAMNNCSRKIKTALLFTIAQLFLLGALCQQVKRPPLTGIAFVQVQVSDTKKARVFYESLMGYTLSAGAAVHGGTIHINQRQSIQIQDGLPAGKDERLLCVAFQTTDAAAMHQYLRAKGVAVPATLRKAADGSLSFGITDPDKHPIQFVQYAGNVKAQALTVPGSKAISRRILHAGLTIADSAAAGVFYRDILGFAEIWRGGSNDSVTSWINMRVPEGTDYLEYMLVGGPVSRQQLGSLHHIALMVPDMQQAVDLLGARSAATGYPVSAPRVGRNNRWQLNLFDPDGTRIELMEPFTMR